MSFGFRTILFHHLLMGYHALYLINQWGAEIVLSDGLELCSKKRRDYKRVHYMYSLSARYCRSNLYEVLNDLTPYILLRKGPYDSMKIRPKKLD